MLANDPSASERLKEGFVRDTHNSISSSFKHNAGNNDLRNQSNAVATMWDSATQTMSELTGFSDVKEPKTNFNKEEDN